MFANLLAWFVLAMFVLVILAAFGTMIYDLVKYLQSLTEDL